MGNQIPILNKHEQTAIVDKVFHHVARFNVYAMERVTSLPTSNAPPLS